MSARLLNYFKKINKMELNPIDVFKSYGFKVINNMEDLKTKMNVPYFKSRSYKINYYVQNNLIDIPSDFIEYAHEYGNKEYTFKYYVGQRIICRQTFKRKRCKLYTNFIYEIMDIADDELTIKNVNDNTEMVITVNQLKYMSLPYSSTCHSVQGLTIHEPYTIFDCNVAYTDRRWIYTAVSRCVSCLLCLYFELKAKNYFKQDIIAGRITNDEHIEDFITASWMMKQVQRCYICNEEFEYELCDGKVVSNMTVDRKDNAKPHIESNCKMCCLLCNCSKRNL